MIFQLDDELWFPDPHNGEPDGLIAIGGDLSVDRLLLAYYYGIFPWYSFRYNHEPHWYCPLQRFVIFPNEIHVSHSMRTLLNKQRFRCSFNEDFGQVIRNCSQQRYEEEGAWLGEEMIAAYTELHRQRLATSVEVWEPQTDGSERLVGGLYGVSIGRAFFGESMFSLVPSGSKVALIHLARFMADHGGVLIDCQLETPHLRSMGGRYIPYDEYLKLIHSEEFM
jgi:leucyl/phenylalanyl-tRNA--protein transferase